MDQWLRLAVRPEWSEIEGIRGRARAFLDGFGFGPEVVDAVAMVTCELVENAIKYGEFRRPEDSIHVLIAVDAHAVTVEVKNRVSEKPQHSNLQRLDEMIQWIRGFQDPFQAYLERLKVVSGQSLTSKESGLGLVRIAYEGQCILDFFVDAQDVLAVSAVYRLGRSAKRAS